MSTNPLEYLAAHWPSLVGCASFLVFLNRVYKLFKKGESYADSIIDARTDQKLMMTNHLPHLQMGLDEANLSMDKINQNLDMLREEMKEHMTGLRDDLRVLLVKGAK